MPIYAGTQLAFYPNNVPPGYCSIQPFVFGTIEYGSYSSHWSPQKRNHIDKYDLLITAETGITHSLDVTLLTHGFYSQFGSQHSWLYGDTKVLFGWQILHDKRENWIPDMRLLFGESFPTGKYQRLNLSKDGSDSSGSGAYSSIFILVLAKTFFAFPKHPFNLNVNLYYILSAPTKVMGLNTYGGTTNTHGTVKPGDEFIVNFAFQYSLSQLWVLGIDIRYDHQNVSQFSGKKGRFSNGVEAVVGLPSSEQFSLAPCLEYSWNENLSVAAGPWFTVAGRNSTTFLSAVANVYYLF